jgi:putative solute:sodium symporter small subunit
MPPADPAPRDHGSYWRANTRLIAALLGVWFAVSYGCGIILAEPLHGIRLGELPLSFWFAHQGSMVVFVVLIFVYAAVMDRIDRKHGVDEDEE